MAPDHYEGILLAPDLAKERLNREMVCERTGLDLQENKSINYITLYYLEI